MDERTLDVIVAGSGVDEYLYITVQRDIRSAVPELLCFVAQYALLPRKYTSLHLSRLVEQTHKGLWSQQFMA